MIQTVVDFVNIVIFQIESLFSLHFTSERIFVPYHRLCVEGDGNDRKSTGVEGVLLWGEAIVMGSTERREEHFF